MVKGHSWIMIDKRTGFIFRIVVNNGERTALRKITARIVALLILQSLYLAVRPRKEERRL